GTVIGLIGAFAALGSADPTEKADLLSRGISEAMNCTAFGLMVAIPTLIVHAWLQAKTTELIDSLEAACTKFVSAASRK
ncbi:MAG TPA: MotA/TolQ/ExbB proton channel family protein, partial [Solimonas sp.]